MNITKGKLALGIISILVVCLLAGIGGAFVANPIKAAYGGVAAEGDPISMGASYSDLGSVPFVDSGNINLQETDPNFTYNSTTSTVSVPYYSGDGSQLSGIIGTGVYVDANRGTAGVTHGLKPNDPTTTLTDAWAVAEANKLPNIYLAPGAYLFPPVIAITVEAAAGQKDVTVADASEYRAGQTFKIYDSAGSEENAIASIAGNVITMTTNLTNTYTLANTPKVCPLPKNMHIIGTWHGGLYPPTSVHLRGITSYRLTIERCCIVGTHTYYGATNPFLRTVECSFNLNPGEYIDGLDAYGGLIDTLYLGSSCNNFLYNINSEAAGMGFPGVAMSHVYMSNCYGYYTFNSVTNGYSVYVMGGSARYVIAATCSSMAIDLYSGAGNRVDNNAAAGCYVESKTSTVQNVVKIPATVLVSQVTITSAPADIALGTITPLANIPTGARISKVLINMSFTDRSDTSTATNSLSGAQYIKMNKNGGAYSPGITLPDGALNVPGSGARNGGVIKGTTDLSGLTLANGSTLLFQWTQAKSIGDSLILDNVQIELEIWYTM